MQESEDIRRKRLLYQASRRGFKEADLVIGGFAVASLSGMSAEELDQFERLLAQSDHDLYAWARGEIAAPEEFSGAALDRLRAFAKS
jgi:antitoxin CptB